MFAWVILSVTDNRVLRRSRSEVECVWIFLNLNSTINTGLNITVSIHLSAFTEWKQNTVRSLVAIYMYFYTTQQNKFLLEDCCLLGCSLA
jgi:hypothetical protein